MKGKNAMVAKPKPANYTIPQTVTSPVERREIRQFINMRLDQMKDRLDRIYKFNKEKFVDKEYERKAALLTKTQKL